MNVIINRGNIDNFDVNGMFKVPPTNRFEVALYLQGIKGRDRKAKSHIYRSGIKTIDTTIGNEAIIERFRETINKRLAEVREAKNISLNLNKVVSESGDSYTTQMFAGIKLKINNDLTIKEVIDDSY